MEIREAIEYGHEALEGICTNPYQETVFILEDLLQRDKTYLIFHHDENLTRAQEDQFLEIIVKRRQHMPLAYVNNRADFMNWEFFVNQDVLIPRFDTERSVEVLQSLLAGNHKKFLEIGVGSGAVILSLALTDPNHIYHGVDISSKALEVAMKNRDRYELKQVELWESDLFEHVDESYNIIYSNPPYITTSAMEELDQSVRDYEPYLALHGGEDGLDFYRAIIEQGRNYLNPKGHLMFEIGYDQKDQVKELLLNHQYTDIEIIYDYQDHPRVVLARKGE